MEQLSERGRKILDIAQDLFLTFGYRKTTLDDVAAGAHIRKSSLYYYFSSKEELFRAVVSRRREEQFKIYQTVLKRPINIRKCLIEFAKILVEEYERWSRAVKILYAEFTDIIPILKNESHCMLSDLEAMLKQRLEKAVEAGELKPLPIDNIVGVILLMINALHNPPELMHYFQRYIKCIPFLIDVILIHYYTEKIKIAD